MRILIDLDNTLIETRKGKMTPESRLLWHELRKLRKESDVKLVGFTSRPSVLKYATLLHLRLLKIDLDEVVFNKPRGEVYIGNRAVNFDCRTSDATGTISQVRKILEK